jgi:hypothetical protein
MKLLLFRFLAALLSAPLLLPALVVRCLLPESADDASGTPIFKRPSSYGPPS